MENYEIESIIEYGQYKKAIDVLNSQKLHLDEAERNYLLGSVYSMLGRIEESIHHYKKAIKKNFNYLPAVRNLTSLLAQNGYKREAIKLLNTILDMFSKDELGTDKNELYVTKKVYESKYKVVAIHQPDYFPWLGYFHKIYYSDIFIILDNVEFSKNSLTKRTQIIKSPSSPEKTYLSLPLKKRSDFSLIKDVLIDNSQGWQKKHLNQIKGVYNKSPFFKEYYPLIKDIILNCSNIESLTDTNICIIKSLLNILSIRDNTVLSSSLPVNGKRSELNINLTKHFNGNIYLSGRGAKAYQSDTEFKEAGIKLIYQNIYNFIEMNPYRQIQGDFINSLSILDALFNIGVEGIIKIFENYENVLFE